MDNAYIQTSIINSNNQPLQGFTQPGIKGLLTHDQTNNKHHKHLAKTIKQQRRTADQYLGKTTNQNSSKLSEVLTQPVARVDQQPVKISERNSISNLPKPVRQNR